MIATADCAAIFQMVFQTRVVVCTAAEILVFMVQIFNGLHTVAIENVPEGVKVYNRSNKTEIPVIYSDLDDYMDSGRFIRG